MVQLRFEIDTTKVAVAPAVLVHREDGPGGVTLYFLTTEHLLHPPALAAARSERSEESLDEEARLDLAVLRIVVEKSPLMPAGITLDPPGQGDSFVVVSHGSTGSQIAVPQRIGGMSDRSAVGDLEMPSIAECVGAPAFSEKGVFGIVTHCEAGKPPTITLLAGARELLRRLIPSLDLGPDGSLPVGVGN